MTLYTGPNPNIADGNALSAADVEDSFNRFATAVNSVDSTNLSSSKTVLSYRSVHPEALTAPFRQGQLIYREPAAWVVVGRGGAAGSEATRFSLGPLENNYTVDGCSVRVAINGDGRASVHSFIQIESVKVADQVAPSATASLAVLTSLDLNLVFKLKYVTAGYSIASATTLHTVTKKIKLDCSGSDYDNTLLLRRGFSVNLSDDVTLSGVDGNGTAFDFFVTMECSIPAAAAVGGGGGTDRTLNSGTHYNDFLFLAHIRSYSRYTTARVFLK
tara:strand:+ start:1437 stop:2255 length:819 start_codon:yes stop_codon:yes gene_type:complete